jgi:hypothetical protein
MWGWLAADLAYKAIGTDYARVIRAIFLLAQARFPGCDGLRSKGLPVRDSAGLLGLLQVVRRARRQATLTTTPLNRFGAHYTRIASLAASLIWLCMSSLARDCRAGHSGVSWLCCCRGQVRLLRTHGFTNPHGSGGAAPEGGGATAGGGPAGRARAQAGAASDSAPSVNLDKSRGSAVSGEVVVILPPYHYFGSSEDESHDRGPIVGNSSAGAATAADSSDDDPHAGVFDIYN